MNNELVNKLDKLEHKVSGHDKKIAKVIRYLSRFAEIHEMPRKKIGFKRRE